MKILIILLVVNICVCNPMFQQLMDLINNQNSKTKFTLWHYALQKPYDLNSEISFQKYKVFKSNIKLIKESNSRQNDYKLGLGPFTDLTWDEFKESHLSEMEAWKHSVVQEKSLFDLMIDEEETKEEFIHNFIKGYEGPLITSKDYRKLHPQAKDQLGCGSCWAFATVASLEGQLLLKNNYQTLSEQELVDCAAEGNGCEGDNYHHSFPYVMNLGLSKGTDYKYVSTDKETIHPCKSNEHHRYIKTFRTYISCSIYANYTPIFAKEVCNLGKILNQLERGPVATLIEVNDGLQHYMQGTWYPTKCTRINHAVEIVYIEFYPVEFVGKVTIRNSWGSNWGKNGLGEIIAIATQGLFGCGTLEHSFIATDLEI